MYTKDEQKITLNFVTVEKMRFMLCINFYLRVSSATLRGAARRFKYFNFYIIISVTGADLKPVSEENQSENQIY